jgi:hypothetical protein
MGYSITKVVETLSNDHLRRLGDEVKRASVLMALSAAGIPLGGHFAGLRATAAGARGMRSGAAQEV